MKHIILGSEANSEVKTILNNILKQSRGGGGGDSWWERKGKSSPNLPKKMVTEIFLLIFLFLVINSHTRI